VRRGHDARERDAALADRDRREHRFSIAGLRQLESRSASMRTFLAEDAEYFHVALARHRPLTHCTHFAERTTVCLNKKWRQADAPVQ
jgi:hypothetical protein